MQRVVTASVLGLTCLLMAGAVEAEQPLLNAELTGGAGISAYNTGSGSLLAPPQVQLGGAYLLVWVGPVAMGPALSVPLGFYASEEEDDEGSWLPQLALRPGWSVYGRPSVDLAWSATVGPSFIVTPPFSWGLEVSGLAVYFLTAGFGLTAGIDYGFFYGVDAVHVFTGRLGLMISWEVPT